MIFIAKTNTAVLTDKIELKKKQILLKEKIRLEKFELKKKQNFLQELIKFYKQPPSFIDENGFYYLNHHILLPELSDYTRRLIIHSAIYYFDDNIILLFKNNGKKDFIDIKQFEEDFTIINEKTIRFKDLEKISNFKDYLFLEDYSIFGFFYNRFNKENKEIIFNCTFNDKQYMAITDSNMIKLINIEYISEEQLRDEKNLTTFPSVITKKIKNNQTEIIYIAAQKHLQGECRKIYINKEKKETPKIFLFYFFILRMNGNGIIERINLYTYDCEANNNSQQII